MGLKLEIQSVNTKHSIPTPLQSWCGRQGTMPQAKKKNECFSKELQYPGKKIPAFWHLGLLPP